MDPISTQSGQKDGDSPDSKEQESQRRLATLGTLSSSIAHDLNNLVMTIQGSAEMSLRDINNFDRVKKGFDNILLAARHSRELIEQIQAFNRNEKIELKPIELRKVILESEQLILVKTPQNVKVDFAIPNDDIFIMGNESQFQQILMNLCTNGIQAMRDNGGTLSVEARILENDNSCPDLKIIVKDTGYGISQEALEKIFDPYFTTKSLGLGVGLGLSVVKTIVDQYGGNISVESKQGQGTCFTMAFTTTDETPANTQASNESPYELPPSHLKKAILLVDDEPFMRGLGMDMLHSLGYRVTVASNGKEALSIVSKKPDYFDIVLSDSKMPEMTGPELAEELHTINPELPFILVTAFSDSQTEERLKSIGVSDIVKKPFLIKNLESALTEALKKQGDKLK